MQQSMTSTTNPKKGKRKKKQHIRVFNLRGSRNESNRLRRIRANTREICASEVDEFRVLCFCFLSTWSSLFLLNNRQRPKRRLYSCRILTFACATDDDTFSQFRRLATSPLLLLYALFFSSVVASDDITKRADGGKLDAFTNKSTRFLFECIKAEDDFSIACEMKSDDIESTEEDVNRNIEKKLELSDEQLSKSYSHANQTEQMSKWCAMKAFKVNRKRENIAWLAKIDQKKLIFWSCFTLWHKKQMLFVVNFAFTMAVIRRRVLFYSFFSFPKFRSFL